MKLNYVDPDAPEVRMPEYQGQYYESMIPATLDLAERAALAVNGLTETLDPEYDYELYWIVDLLAKKPAMYHTVDDHVQAKFFQALPLVRTASGSKQNMDIEKSQMQTYLRMQGDDGLIYIPLKGRPWGLPSEPNPWAGLDFMPQGNHWCSLVTHGRVLAAFCIYALKDPEGPWREAANRLVEGIKKVTIVEDDIAYLFLNCTEPGKEVKKPEVRPVGMRAAANGWIAQGLIQCYRSLGNSDALEIGEKMMRYIMRDSGYFGDNGEFKKEFPGKNELIHFHAHTNQIMTALEVVQANGSRETLNYALKGYEYAVSQGEPLLGFFPEWLNYKGGGYGLGPCSSEICEVADMIAAAVKLSLLGYDKWDDVDRWTRNQFAECQLTNTNWLTDGHIELTDRDMSPLPAAGCSGPEYGTTDRVLERVVGTFSGWPSANDFVQGRGWSIMHCCTGNATRAIYYIWENIINYKDRELKVNLLMNRASRWADIDSHIPYSGRVDIKVKQNVDLKVRIAEWVKPEDVRCTVNGKDIEVIMDGRYIQAGSVCNGDEVVVQFPIYERTETVIVEKQKYTIILRGNDVVNIDPPGTNWPLYQRGHYRTGETLWKKATRFVPVEEIKWC
ncbi:MAG: glycoside hydrolase family 127 protein [Clostridiales bacterium]|nr:glycoside hydrolase family 127 protein [Clostridiales bacterium]